jgi:DNA polymerase I-like protein with 3'-5' exonuclease and polymerase domains
MFDGVEIIAPRAELSHPMWRRMWERAGIDPATVRVHPLEQWRNSVPAGVTVLIPMGEAALRAVGTQSDLFRWRGRRFTRFLQPDVLVCPTLLPSQLLPRLHPDASSQLSLRPTRFQGAWIFDVQRAFRETGPVPSPTLEYWQDPSPDRFAQWATQALQSPHAWLSFDIETHYKLDVTDESAFDEEELKMGAMLRISFAYQPHQAVSVPWSREYLDTIRTLLESPMAKVVWNGAQFDVPRLRDEGFAVHGTIYDMQDGWHLLESDQPKGLEYVSSFYTRQIPWKHLSSAQPALYSCIDADIALQNALGIAADLRHFGQWELFERHVVRLMPILDRAGLRGNMIDQTFSAELRHDLEMAKQTMLVQAQAYVPNVLKPRKRFKRRPDDAEGRIVEPVTVRGTTTCCTVCKTLGVKKADHFKGGKKNPCKAAQGTIITVEADVTEWDEVLPFNPSSSQQMLAYMMYFKHPKGKDRKTGAPSADSKHIAKLAGKYGSDHPIYPMLADYSKVAKTLSTYIYAPDAHGLIHTTYVNAPSTWRLASRNVNLQNVGKRESNKWAKKARRQIVARPGQVFVGADSTSIEAVITGWLIGDDNFIAVAKKSIHAYLCCQDLGWEFTDETIEQVKKSHKKLYNQFKTAVYLLLYGGDPYLMHMTNPEQFPTKADAQLVQDKIFGMMPALKAWQDQTREQAKKDGELRSPWGYRHKFYDVYTFKKGPSGDIEFDEQGSPRMRLGQDAKRALAFKPQNAAGAFCRDTLLHIGESAWGPYMSANVSVHDGYTLEVPESMKDAAADFLVETLTRPIPELGGLRIGCEVEWGYNWADATADNPHGMQTIRKVEV